jgi:hypothetical protein
VLFEQNHAAIAKDSARLDVLEFHRQLKCNVHSFARPMSSTKDGDGPNLSVVGGTDSASGGDAPESTDKTTLLKLAQLRQEHRDLDEAIQALTTSGPFDQLQLTRLKKKKLMLRDQITKIEDQIVPDIIA